MNEDSISIEFVKIWEESDLHDEACEFVLKAFQLRFGKESSNDQALPEKYILSENRLLELSSIIKAGSRNSPSGEKNIGLMIT